MTILIIIFIAVGLYIYEKRNINSKQIALISIMSALGALGRIPFAAIPNVQPTTFIVIVTGYSMGPLAGFVTGVLSAGISNFFLGQGPWTPWQMIDWGFAGVTAGLAGKIKIGFNKPAFAIFCGVWGFLFGWIMNFWTWYSYTSPHSLKGYLILCASSFWFDTLHGAGNIIFAWLFGAEFVNIVTRFQRKMSIDVKIEEENRVTQVRAKYGQRSEGY
ncbi:MAG: ECF transporter S component [Deltaproteobacteria bacterium]